MNGVLCRDCGRDHEDGGQALACDHNLGRHSERLVDGCGYCADPGWFGIDHKRRYIAERAALKEGPNDGS